ncbi:MAG: NF038122 family metalloprotease, partial [Chthoniobacteraceae bacterium]
MKTPHLLNLFASAYLSFILSTPATAQLTVVGSMPASSLPGGTIVLAGDTVDNVLIPRAGGSLPAVPAAPATNLGAFDIVIAPGSALSGNPAALAAFNRAAQAWEARISDPITVTINADLASLASGIIGSTSAVTIQAGYTTIRDRLVADAAADSGDAITASLPTAAQFLATIPSGSTLDGSLLGTKANLKAIGFSNLDTSFGATDATITFSTNFAFDFDNSDGVTPGFMDFETVATHEIGHALGFISSVDGVNAGDTSIAPYLLDLYRFANNTADDPGSAAEFAAFTRNLVPGVDAITDQIFGTPSEWRMSTGLNNGTFSGTDGRQASHWKADELTGEYIGMMDPTLAFGVVQALTEADFRSLDLIGYDIVTVPEFSTSTFGIFAALAGIALPRRRAGAARRQL